MASEYKYRFTNKAATDLDEILSYMITELCNVKAAKDFYNEVFKQIDNVCQFPESGALIENEYLADKTIRRFLVDTVLQLIIIFPCCVDITSITAVLK